MIDLHSHILPGIDDGPEDLPGSLALAEAAVREGITTIAATPHVNSRFQLAADELAALPGKVAALNGELERRTIPLRVVKGGEVALLRLRGLDRDQLRGLCLGEGRHLLVESPYSKSVPLLDEIVFGVRAQGVEVLLAHPERCPAFAGDPDQLARLVGSGVLCLVNAGSLQGVFGRTVQRFALRLLRDGLVHGVASDAHDHARRPPVLSSGLQSAQSSLPDITAQFPRLIQDAPQAILAGDPVPPAVPLPQSALRRLLARG